MDPLGIITSAITLVHAISSTYQAIQHLEGLPDEFNEVSRNLPLAQETLNLARQQLEGPTLDDCSRLAIQPVISDCEERARTLLGIFKKIEDGVKDARGGSALALYRISLLRLGKARRVETLMQGLLGGLNELGANHLFRTAPQIQNQMAEIKDAIDKLSKVKSSVSDSELEPAGTNIQHVASGGTGNQYNITGQNHTIFSGSGPSYNAHSMSFVKSSGNLKVRRTILQALHTSPYLDRKNRNRDRVPGTCEWFMKHVKFQRWRRRKSSALLWVSANPGCGKSVLAKYLVDLLKTTESRTTCYFFFKDDFEDQKSARSALSCILHQLFTQREEYFSDEIVERFKAYKDPISNSYYHFWDLWDILVRASTIPNAGEIICLLDGFDECHTPERQELAKALCKFYGPENEMKDKMKLKFIVTSRPYDAIRQGFQQINIPEHISNLPIIHLKGEGDAELSKISREIDIYIRHRVFHLQQHLHLKSDEETLLLQELRAVPNQTYLWVYLTLEWIETEIKYNINKDQIRNVTSSIPRTVNEAYDKILSKSKDITEAKKLLHIVVAAAWPLNLSEIGLALAINECHTSSTALARKPDQRVGKYIRDLCGLFVNIIDSKVYLLHQTAKEFLVPRTPLDPPLSNVHLASMEGDYRQLTWKSSLHPSESHRILFQICIWYLLFDEFETGRYGRNKDDHIFLDYAAKNWATHFRASDTKEGVFREPLKILCDTKSRRCQTWFKIYWKRVHGGIPQKFTSLMIASYFGLEELVKIQIDLEDEDINSTDAVYRRSALSWASENGFYDIVKLLITGPKIKFRNVLKFKFPKSAKVDSRDIDNRTPLSYAIWNRHTAVAGRLIKAGARGDVKDAIGGSPISYALISGQSNLTGELVKASNSASVNEIRDELLLSATSKGREAFVERLIDDGADIEAHSGVGLTPLLSAVARGHESITRLLLNSGADIEARNKMNQTPLLSAISCQHTAITKLLLDKGANIEAEDNSETPLLLAAGYGFEDITKLLLDKGANIEAKNQFSQTPLLAALTRRHEKIMKLLLSSGANTEAQDMKGETTLVSALESQYLTIAEKGSFANLLLNHGADTEAKNHFGETPLLMAVSLGLEDTTKLLLEKGANIEAKNGFGQTPLLAAVQRRPERIMKLLLSSGANTEARDMKGETALLSALSSQCLTISEKGSYAKLLLDHGADTEAKNNLGETPLLVVASRGYEDVASLLLDRGADVQAHKKDGTTPMLAARAGRDHQMMKLLRDYIQAKEPTNRWRRAHFQTRR